VNLNTFSDFKTSPWYSNVAGIFCVGKCGFLTYAEEAGIHILCKTSNNSYSYKLHFLGIRLFPCWKKTWTILLHYRHCSLHALVFSF